MAGGADEGQADRSESLGLVVDRHADVPVGAQIGWALRTRISEGVLQPGARLPGLRELAEATGVNVNTARTVYQRLEQAGLIDSQQGTGTFVAAAARRSALGQVAALAAEEARDHGVSARELAVALYVRPDAGDAGPAADFERRRSLRRQIAALEMAASELEAQHAVAVPDAGDLASSRTSGAGPSLLGVAELEAVRGDLVRRLVAVQAAIGGERDESGPRTGRLAREAKAPKPAASPQRSAARRSRRRPPHAGLAGA
jgi:DNA-binding transcriptional regulator YhcF (GntR family)